MKQKPNLPFWSLWNLSFGFFGVQIAYALQSANISRIFRTLGADPHDLSFFWILPPLMGILVQPIVGTLSDKTWCRYGRRIPYLFIGAAVAVAVMCLLPNSGSLHLAVSAALIFGLIALMLLDTSINMAMQPFKMLVGDMVNEEQKAKAYSIQSFLCNAGSVAGYIFPFILTWIGMPPEEYAQYHGLKDKEGQKDSANWFVLLKNAPSTFWKVGLVQFFCWAAFLYMWTYVVDAVSETVWNTTDPTSEDYQVAGNWTGVLYAVQAMSSVVWATILPRFSNMKMAYAVSLILGGIGFALIPFMPSQYGQILPFLLIGCGWAAMLAMPFTFVTNALEGYGHMGAYLGLFNGTICLPQIVAALCGGTIFSLVGGHQSTMMIVAGVSMVIGACCVSIIGERK